MRLTIKDPNSLLSVFMDREVTPDQVQKISLVLASDVSPGKLAWLLDGDIGEEDEREFERKHSTPGYDAPFGAGDDVEAYRG